jgi:hypothetical protein
VQEGCRRIQNNDDDDDDDDWDADTRCYHDPLYIKHDYDKSKFYHTPGCTPPSSTCHGAPRRNIHMGHMTVSISLFEMRGVHTSQYQCKPHAERDRRLVGMGGCSIGPQSGWGGHSHFICVLLSSLACLLVCFYLFCCLWACCSLALLIKTPIT